MRASLKAPLVSLLILGLSSCDAKQVGVEGENGGGDGGAQMKPDACMSLVSQATVVKRPIDIIIIIDNSDSMRNEIEGVQQNINQNFTQIIGESGVDYRVILLSKHGSAAATQSICISKPLSGNPDCANPGPRPINGPRFFHYSEEVTSSNSFKLLLDTYNKADPSGQAPGGWSEWLRAEAHKAFIEITDDSPAMTADAFKAALFMKTPMMFGTPAMPNFVFHTIGGMKANTPATKPWLPGDNLIVDKCRDKDGKIADGNGLEYQKLSKDTGGLRFPVCEYGSFDEVFRSVAGGVIQGAQVPCELVIPAAPPGQTIDQKTVVVEYTPGQGGAAQVIKKAESLAACAPGSFYIAGGKIVLCPDTCQAVKTDDKARLDVRFDCLVEIL